MVNQGLHCLFKPPSFSYKLFLFKQHIFSPPPPLIIAFHTTPCTYIHLCSGHEGFSSLESHHWYHGHDSERNSTGPYHFCKELRFSCHRYMKDHENFMVCKTQHLAAGFILSHGHNSKRTSKPAPACTFSYKLLHLNCHYHINYHESFKVCKTQHLATG